MYCGRFSAGFLTLFEEHVEDISAEMSVSSLPLPGMKAPDCQQRGRVQLFSLLLKAPFSSHPGAEQSDSRHSFSTRLRFSFRFHTSGLMNNQLNLPEDPAAVSGM